MRELELKNVIKFDNREFLVSTINIHICRPLLEDDIKKTVYETMVFEMINDKVQYHEIIFNERYNMSDEATAEHNDILKNPEVFFVMENYNFKY